MFLLSECLQSRRDFRFLIEAGQLIRPGTVAVEVSAHIRHQIPQAFSFVIACDFVMHIAEGAFDRVGTGTIGGQPQDLKARMSGPPLLNCLCFVDAVVICYEGHTVVTLRRITDLERVEQMTKERVRFALSAAEMNDTGAQIPTRSEERRVG